MEAVVVGTGGVLNTGSCDAPRTATRRQNHHSGAPEFIKLGVQAANAMRAGSLETETSGADSPRWAGARLGKEKRREEMESFRWRHHVSIGGGSYATEWRRAALHDMSISVNSTARLHLTIWTCPAQERRERLGGFHGHCPTRASCLRDSSHVQPGLPVRVFSILASCSNANRLASHHMRATDVDSETAPHARHCAMPPRTSGKTHRYASTFKLLTAAAVCCGIPASNSW